MAGIDDLFNLLNNSKKFPELPEYIGNSPSDIVAVYNTITQQLEKIQKNKLQKNPKYSILFLGTVETSTDTTTDIEIINKINSVGFEIAYGEMKFIKLVIKISNVFYTRVYAHISNEVGVYGNNQTIALFSDFSSIIDVVFNEETETTEVIDLGDLGSLSIEEFINGTNDFRYNLDAGIIYLFKAIIDGVNYSYLYVGNQPILLGLDNNTSVANDFQNISNNTELIDYNDLINTPIANDTIVDTYQNIPDKSGTYFVSDKLSMQNIQTNVNFNGSFISFKDFIEEADEEAFDVFGSPSYLTVVRQSTNYQIGSPTTLIKINVDDVYFAGLHVCRLEQKDATDFIAFFSEKGAYNYVTYFNERTDVSPKYLRVLSSRSSTRASDVSSSKVKFIVSGDFGDFESDKIKGEILFNTSSPVSITDSKLYLGERLISDYDLGIKKFFNSATNFNEDKLAIYDRSGAFFKSGFGNKLTLYYEGYESESVNIGNSNSSIFYNNKRHKSLNSMVTEVDTPNNHDGNMAGTFLSIYSGFGTDPGTLFYTDNFGVPNNQAVFSNDPKTNYVIDNNVGLFFEARDNSPSNFINYENKRGLLYVSPLGSNDNIRTDVTDTISTFYNNTVLVVSRSDSDNGDETSTAYTSYGFGAEFNEPTLETDHPSVNSDPNAFDLNPTNYLQSPATAIVAAKLKYIKDQSKAPWNLVREAARETASNANNYNIYRGFGQINVAAAIPVAIAKLNAYSAEIAKYYDDISPFNGDLQYADKLPNTLVTKQDIEDQNFKDAAKLQGSSSSDFVRSTGNLSQTITGKKTFNETIRANKVGGNIQLRFDGTLNDGFLGMTSGGDLVLSDFAISRGLRIFANGTYQFLGSGSVTASEYKSSSDVAFSSLTLDSNIDTGLLNGTMKNGRVILSGNVTTKSSISGLIICTLPTTLRPEFSQYFIVYLNESGKPRLSAFINTSGNIIVEGLQASKSYLISFEFTKNIIAI